MGKDGDEGWEGRILHGLNGRKRIKTDFLGRIRREKRQAEKDFSEVTPGVARLRVHGVLRTKNNARGFLRDSLPTALFGEFSPKSLRARSPLSRGDSYSGGSAREGTFRRVSDSRTGMSDWAGVFTGRCPVL